MSSDVEKTLFMPIDGFGSIVAVKKKNKTLRMEATMRQVTWTSVITRLCLVSIFLILANTQAFAETMDEKKVILKEALEATNSDLASLQENLSTESEEFLLMMNDYLKRTETRPENIDDEAEALAKEIYSHSKFKYNVELRLLAQLRLANKDNQAILSLCQAMCEQWYKKRWVRRLVVSGIVIGAVAVAATGVTLAMGAIVAPLSAGIGGAVAGAGAAAISQGLYFAEIGAIVGTTITVDSALVLASFKMWRANPSVILYPELNDDLRKTIQKGGKVECVTDVCEMPKDEEVGFSGLSFSGN